MDKIGLKRRPQWIPLPSRTEDLLSCLANDCVVEGNDEGNDEGLIFWEGLNQAISHMIKKAFFVDATFGVEAVIETPVLMLGTTDADQIGESAPVLIKQSREHVLVESMRAGR